MKLCACGCGQPRDREGQRYRRACHAAYMQRWRTLPLATRAMRQRYRASKKRLQSELDAFREGR